MRQTLMVRWWADEAHDQGMAIGLKNAGNMLELEGEPGTYQKELGSLFDFNVIEACVSCPISRV
jgi:hypothetical protein